MTLCPVTPELLAQLEWIKRLKEQREEEAARWRDQPRVEIPEEPFDPEKKED